MSKIYDLYPSYERKIDKWRKRILGYEKMKRDMQRQIQILKNKNKKQKEVIDKATEYIMKNRKEITKYEADGTNLPLKSFMWDIDKLLDILKEK